MKKSVIAIFLFTFAGMHVFASAWGPWVTLPRSGGSVASALAEYYLDCGAFPPPLPEPPYGLQRLTTPIPYLAALPVDPFAPPQRLTLFRIVKSKFDFIFFSAYLLALIIWGIRVWRKRKSVCALIPVALSYIPFFFFFFVIYWANNVNVCGIHLLDFSREWMLVNSLQYREGAEYSFLYGLSEDGYGVVVSAGSACEHRLTQDVIRTMPSKGGFREERDCLDYFAGNYHGNVFLVVGSNSIEIRRLKRIEAAEKAASDLMRHDTP